MIEALGSPGFIWRVGTVAPHATLAALRGEFGSKFAKLAADCACDNDPTLPGSGGGAVLCAMKFILQFGLIAVVAAALSGCATTDSASRETRANKDGAAMAEAPLGSRIRKKNAINPVAGANKDDIEMGKVRQNAEHSRAYK